MKRRTSHIRRAALLLLISVLLLSGCQKGSTVQSSASENVHLLQTHGKDYYVLDQEYTGEYHVQRVYFDANPLEYPMDGDVYVLAEDEGRIPEDFARQAVMSAAEYADYCSQWGMEPAYTDPDRAYAVIAGGEGNMDVVHLQLADVQTEGQLVKVYLRDRFHNPSAHSIGFVVTIPVDPGMEAAELVPTCDAEEAENLVKYGKMYNPNDLPAPEKPVIYLYPETETEVRVCLEYDGTLTCTYPAYRDGWTVTAKPDGTLTDAGGQSYSYLYWEGQGAADYDFSTGFCVRGEDTAAFLEQALAQLGLSRREANEFIVYWLPRMEANPWNLISFQTSAYTDHAPLEITPAPDTVIRVFMAWKPLPSCVQIEAQTLQTPERSGFTVVEWGGAEIKDE